MENVCNYPLGTIWYADCWLVTKEALSAIMLVFRSSFPSSVDFCVILADEKKFLNLSFLHVNRGEIYRVSEGYKTDCFCTV